MLSLSDLYSDLKVKYDNLKRELFSLRKDVGYLNRVIKQQKKQIQELTEKN